MLQGSTKHSAVMCLGVAAMFFSAMQLAPSTPTTPTLKSTNLRDTHERLHGVLWAQTSAEYRTLAQATYRLGVEKLDVALQDPNWTAAIEQQGNAFSALPPAVIVDIDETVFDNSRYQGQLVDDRGAYSEELWKEWAATKGAGAVPGALDFAEAARDKSIQVFYVTNRSADLEEATRANLTTLGFPLPDMLDVVLCKGEHSDWGSDKSTRRSFVATNYRILLLVGDDLGDFVSGASDCPARRIALADKYQSQWGTHWMLLPNPLYGSWETSLYDNDFSLPDRKVLERKRARVLSFK